MRTKDRLEYKTTVNRKLYNRLYKRFVSKEHGLCDRCPFSGGVDNTSRSKYYNFSWKKHRNKQHREIDMYSDYDFFDYAESFEYDYFLGDGEGDEDWNPNDVPIEELPEELPPDQEDDEDEYPTQPGRN